MVPTLCITLLLAVANVLSLGSFGFDKWQSKKGGRRIAESRLLFAALIGPFGAYAGMLLFKHKTRKIKFLLVPVFLFIQLILIMYFTSLINL